MGFGSDGANVMVDQRTSVATRLKCDNPFLVSIHCVAHRLALAAAQASDNIPYVHDNFDTILQNLFNFYEHSPVRMSGLTSIQAILNDPEIKLKHATHVRWLLHNKACHALHTLPSVLLSLDREASGRSEPVAAGLIKFTTYKFLATLYSTSSCQIVVHVPAIS